MAKPKLLKSLLDVHWFIVVVNTIACHKARKRKHCVHKLVGELKKH